MNTADDMDIVLRFSRLRWPSWWSLPYRETYERTFRGSCTVWHDIETGERPGTLVEARLSELAWLKRQQA